MDDSFSVGCFACRAANSKTAFGKMETSSRNAIQISNLQGHAKHSCHLSSLEALARSVQQPVPAAGEDVVVETVSGAVSGISDKVPRLDRWVQALELVRTAASYSQMGSLADTASVGSALTPGGDDSRKVAKNLIFSMSQTLSQVDRYMMKKAIKTSISIDKTGEYLLLYCRTLTPYGLYDFLGGVQGDVTGEIPAVSAAMLQILRRMCTRPDGRRKADDSCIYSHDSDKFDGAACSKQSWTLNASFFLCTDDSFNIIR